MLGLLIFTLITACGSGQSTPGDTTAVSVGSTEDSAEIGPDEETGEGGMGGETGGNSDTDVEDTADPNERVFESLITVTETMNGDLSCYRPGTDCWQMRAYENCVNSREVLGVVLDGETKAAMPQASVDVFWSDAISDPPDTTLAADSAGQISGETLPTCVPLTLRVSGGDPEATVPAVYAHQIFPPTDDEIAAVFHAISAESAAALSERLELEPDPALGMVTGRILDCSNAPLVKAQVIAIDAEGNYPAGQTTHYFVDNTPHPGSPTRRRTDAGSSPGCRRGAIRWTSGGSSRARTSPCGCPSRMSTSWQAGSPAWS